MEQPREGLRNGRERDVVGPPASEPSESENSVASDDLESDASDEFETKRHNEMLEGVFGSEYGARESAREQRGQALEEGAAVDLSRIDGRVSVEQLLAPLSRKRSVARLRAHLDEQRAAPVAAPALAPVVKQQVQVQAARDVVRSSLNDWQPAVKRAREAEHVSFPVRTVPVGGASCGALAHSLKPHTSLEKDIEAVLEARGAVLKDSSREEAASENGLPPNPLAPNDLAAQRARVAKIRSLLFFRERQAKRAAKIKSKGYRKMRRREREKAGHAEGEAAVLDEEAADARASKYELRRAKERISLKRQSVSKRFRGQQRVEDSEDLVQRAAVAAAHQESVDSSESDNGSMEDSLEAEAALEQGASMPGVFGMRFMKNYLERQRADGLDDKGGRGPDATVKKGSFDSASLVRGPVLKSYKLRSAGPVSITGDPSAESGKVLESGDPDAAGSESVPRTLEQQRGRAKNTGEKVGESDSSGAMRALSWLKQKSKTGESARRSRKAQTRIVISATDSIETTARDDSAAESAQRVQEDLVAMAFVGGVDRTEDFAAEKSAEIEEGAEKPTPDLPGWGSWSGERIPAKQSKRFRREAAAAERRNTERAAARADAGMSHVIISERRNKRIARYLQDAAPHPHTKPATYESLLKHPLGTEWNPIKSHLDMIAPKVTVQRGCLVEPVVKPTNPRKRARQLRKPL